LTQAEKLTEIFKDKELLEQAFTHKSWVNENQNKRKSNERLEFLGDAILEYIVSKEIYANFPNKEEGYLTTLRSNLVNTKNLAHIAKKLGIGKRIFLSRGEEEGEGRKNPSLLADTLEAVIGALFLDQGIDFVYEFVKKHLLSEVPDKISKPLKDAKSRFQEFVQSQGHAAPIYKVIKASGPDHDKKFIVEVLVDGKPMGKGTGKNKSSAAQSAAENALKET